MNKIVRRFMSGVSLAALSFGVPSFARAGSTVPSQITTQRSGLANDYYNAHNLILVEDPAYGEGAARIEGALGSDEGTKFPADYIAVTGILAHDSAELAADENTIGIDLVGGRDTILGAEMESYILVDAGTEIADKLFGIYEGGAIPFPSGAHGFTGSFHHATAKVTGTDVRQASVANEYRNHHTAHIGEVVIAAHAGRAVAYANGAYQTASATADKIAKNAFNNTTAAVTAFAGAFHARTARARADGVSQFASNTDGPAHNVVYNLTDGFIGASARAAHAGVASAYADGIFQRGEGKTVTNAVHNSGGTIEAFAGVHNAADGLARAVGVYQDPFAESIHNAATNNGVIGVYAHLSHVGAGSAVATGVYQSGGVHGVLVDNYVKNGHTAYHGPADIIAVAVATTVTHAEAFAAGVNQLGIAGNVAASNAHNAVDNSGLIAAAAYVSHAETAYATAIGVRQIASVDGAKASDYALNRHGGTIVAGADASGGTGIFIADHASAHAAGVYQSANALATAHNAVSNYGIVEGGAWAHDAYSVNAHGAGIYQSAYAAGGVGSNKVLNIGTAYIAGVAWASDAYNAHAGAYGIVQQASGVTGNNFVSNHGLIGAFARADEVNRSILGGGGTASAHAVGVQQSATGAVKATNIVRNAGTAAGIGAVAFVYEANDGIARATGVAQHAVGDPATNFVTNHGFVIAEAFVGEDVAHSATAKAVGVYQEASATADGAAANAVYNYSHAYIIAHAQASGAEYDHATAAGVSQSAYSRGGHVGNLVANNGFIGASAYAHGFNDTGIHAAAYTADAYASGIHQRAYGTDAHNTVTNGKKGGIFAFASAATAYDVHARAIGVHQYAHDGATAANLVNNSGLIAASAQAHGFFYTADDRGIVAYATAFGVDQHAFATKSAHNTVHNYYGAGIVAYASANSADAAYAEAKGVNQHAEGTAANNDVYNAGFIVANAEAGGGYDAFARAYGVDQYAAYDAKNTVANYGTIAAHASAYYDVADAEAKGVNQRAYGLGAANSVYNAGLVVAQAQAEGLDAATAYAYGVDQRAYDDAKNSVDNYGTIAAFASAHGLEVPFAEAKGVNQTAGGTKATNSVINRGLIFASAYASHGFHVTAYAYGVDQHAGAEYSANNLVDSYKGGLIVATAAATAAFEGGTEHALAKGVNQRAFGYNAANAVANSGLIAALAAATTSNNFVEAKLAHASAFGVDQNGHGHSARNTVDNYAAGQIVAIADATSAYKATAIAMGVNQDAGAYMADNVVDNGGLIWAEASAAGGRDAYTAVAHGYGVDQFAGAYSAHNGVYNSGQIVAYITARDAHHVSAYAYGIDQAAFGFTAVNHVTNYHGLVFAAAFADNGYTARAHASGADQVAFGDPASNAVDNIHGSIVGFGFAASAYHATAHAKGINQVAFGYMAANSVANSGLIAGAAIALDAHSAFAHAYGIDQRAGGYTAHNTVANHSGTIAAVAAAYDAHYVIATADAIDQHANGHAATNYAANNHGALVWASADAVGGHHAYTASALAYGIDQFAGAYTAHNHVDNSGYIVALASAAHARHVDASARGIGQSAHGHYAHNTVTNYQGLVFASAYAHGGRTVDATARGVDQHAHGDLVAYNLVQGDGTIIADAAASEGYYVNADAKAIDQHAGADQADNRAVVSHSGIVIAFATASDAHHASATARGIDQHAYAHAASNLNGNGVSNSGVVAASAVAGHAYSATAHAYGVDQHVDATHLPFNLVNNHGTIAAVASAYDALHVSAEAKGVNQHAYGHDGTSPANNDLVNSTNAHILAAALAHGAYTVSVSGAVTGSRPAYTADARAYGVDQHADANSGAHNNVHNTGYISAFAIASHALDATAEAKGVNQHANAYTADNDVVNSGFIGGDASAVGAHVMGYQANNATARAYGVDQHATGTEFAHNTVINHGTIAARAFASSAYRITAEAKGVNQYADKPFTGSALNVVDNSHGIIVASAYAFNAHASGTPMDYHPGVAPARAYGVDQRAEGTDAANIVTSHGVQTAYGHIESGVIAAFASASNANFVRAEARGVDQHAYGVNDAVNQVSNYGGLIVATALARNGKGYTSARVQHYTTFDSGTHHHTRTFYENHPGIANADAIAVDQHAGDYVAHNYVYNSGVIAASASASNANFVGADARGVDQRAHGRTALNQVVNHGGLILATANAHNATGFTTSHVVHYTTHRSGTHYHLFTAYRHHDGLANALAIGVDQDAHGLVAHNSVYNSGSIGAHAAAYSATNAHADAAGINQYARGRTAANLVSEYAGNVFAYASASAEDRDHSRAIATASGINQDVGAFDAHNTVINHGSMTADKHEFAGGVIRAIAVASSAYYVRADANAVGQRAGGYTAHNSVVNDGGLIVATAYAHGGVFTSDGAITSTNPARVASAHARGVDQHARGYYAENAVHNSGTIAAAAYASFASHVANADARAVHQSAYGYWAINGVSNAGHITAFASAYDADHANARADGIDQRATGYLAMNIVDNYGGIFAKAVASDAYSANAQARGIDQHAHALGTTAVNNYVSSTAKGRIGASAYAGDAVFGTAGAKGVDQHVDGYHAHNLVYNFGQIEAFATALNNDFNYAAATGVEQHVHAYTGVNHVSNHAGAVIGARAFAGGHNSSAYNFYFAESANAGAVGVDQEVHAHAANNTVINQGDIWAYATAFYAADDLVAHATGIDQSAHGYNATNLVSSIGTKAHISAYAYASRGHHGSAIAHGIDQDVGGYQAHNVVINSGHVLAFASAAHNVTANATATGVRQSAHGYMAANTVDNDAHGVIGASAFAGAHYTAGSNYFIGDEANANAVGVGQEVHGHSVADFVVNQGTIWAHAVADYADADPEAHATGIHQHAGGYYGVNHVTNSAAAYIEANATAAHDGYATARARGVDQHVGAYQAHNLVDNLGHIEAFAGATNDDFGYAVATGVRQHAFGYTAVNLVTNHANARISASAHAGGHDVSPTNYFIGEEADATAIGIAQEARGFHATDVVVNQGVVHARALANYASDPAAYATGIHQHADGYHAQNVITNSAAAHITAFATASNDYDGAARARGIDQHVHGYLAHDLVDNLGHIEVFAGATNDEFGYASASGIRQHAHGYSAANYVSNHAHAMINVSAFAGDTSSNHIKDYGEATAIGIAQEARGHVAYNTVINHGAIHARAEASHVHTAIAVATGIHQEAGGRNAVNFVSNADYIDVTAGAYGVKTAEARAVGVYQDGHGRTVVNHVVNAGTIDAYGTAHVDSAGDPLAEAAALGIHQDFNAAVADATVSNHHYITASAHATVAHGSHQSAYALAGGMLIGETEILHAKTGAPISHARTLHLNVVNHGQVYASAVANVASEGAHGIARAMGIVAVNNATGAGHGIVEGVIENYGEVTAEAHAPVHASGHGSAYGIGVIAKEFVGTIYNYGSVDAQAFGQVAKAIGIGVENNGKTAYGHLGRIVNDGGFVFASTNFGGVGTAINVKDAPNEVDIDLKGTDQMGEIFGNIEDSHTPGSGPGEWTNTITVSNGTTYFDGSLNPGLSTLADGGVLNVETGATLWLPNASTSFWGRNPVLNVANYNQLGTLEINIDGLGNNPTINTVTASLSGTIIVNPNAYTLYVTHTYDIVTGSVSGSWTSPPTVTGPLVGTPLLSFTDPSTAPGTIVVTRTAFNAVPGLTHNEAAVGTGLENGYAAVQASQSLGNPTTAQLFYESLFLFNGTQYPQALNMLSDSQAGEVAQSNVVSANNFDDKIANRLAQISSDVGPTGQIGSMPSAGITFWGAPFGTWNNTASTASGPSYKDNLAGVTLGADTPIATGDGAVLIAGLAVNVESKADITFQNGVWNDLVINAGYGSSRGWDVAGYARYNAPEAADSFYLEATGSYGNYVDTTQRGATLPELSPMPMLAQAPSPGRAALTPAGSPTIADWSSDWLTGSFNSKVWSVYGEGGVPVDLGIENLGFTPYAGVRYIHSGSDSYKEVASDKTNLAAAAALDVNDASASTLESYLGAEFSTTVPVSPGQSLLPTLRVAWAHNFDDPWQVNASFSSIGPTSTFTIDGSSWARDSAVIDLGVSTVFLDNAMVTIGYDANLSGTQTVQSMYGRLDITF